MKTLLCIPSFNLISFIWITAGFTWFLSGVKILLWTENLSHSLQCALQKLGPVIPGELDLDILFHGKSQLGAKAATFDLCDTAIQWLPYLPIFRCFFGLIKACTVFSHFITWKSQAIGQWFNDKNLWGNEHSYCKHRSLDYSNSQAPLLLIQKISHF